MWRIIRGWGATTARPFVSDRDGGRRPVSGRGLNTVCGSLRDLSGYGDGYCTNLVALAGCGFNQLIKNVKLLPDVARSIPRKRCPSAVTAYWATLGFVASLVENRRDGG